MTAVSVIIPVRDGECYLGEAIESVLGQTAPPAEVVVVDDGSADASADIAQGFAPAVRCVRQEAVGLAAACNRGLSEVAGELIAYIDADDLWVAGKLALQRRRLAAEPELDAVFGHAQEFLSPDLTGPPPRCSTEPTPFRQRGTMLIRRDAHDRAGRFDPSWRVGEFIGLARPGLRGRRAQHDARGGGAPPAPARHQHEPAERRRTGGLHPRRARRPAPPPHGDTVSRGPDTDQMPILRAALGDSSVAPAAWRQWVDAGGDIETLDSASSRLLGLVYRNLRTAKGANGVDPRLAGIYRHNWSGNQLRLRAALPLLRRLADEGEPAMLFKGAALLHVLPGGHGIRPMGDVDVLVRPDQVDAAVQALTEEGFLGPGEGRLAQLRNHGHAAHFTLDGVTTVDLHWRSLHGPVDDAAAFADARPMTLAGTPVLIPRPEDALVHVCAHAMAVQPKQRNRVRWLADVALLLRANPALDWNVVIARARAGRVAPAVRDALRTAQDFVGIFQGHQCPSGCSRSWQTPLSRSACCIGSW